MGNKNSEYIGYGKTEYDWNADGRLSNWYTIVNPWNNLKYEGVYDREKW